MDRKIVKKIVAVLSFMVIVAYVLGLLNAPFLYSIFFFTSLWFLLFALALIAGNFIWEYLPQLRRIFANDKGRFRKIYIVSLAFLLMGGWTINHYFLPHKLHPISLLGDFLLLSFILCLGWIRIKPIIKILTVSVIGFTLVILILLAEGYKAGANESTFDTFDKLAALPYLSHVIYEKEPTKKGVSFFNENISYNGINIFKSTSVPGGAAVLMDMEGDILYTWSPKIRFKRLQYVELFNNDGDILAIDKDNSLMMLDRDSNIKWKVKMRAHHDLAIDQKKNIYTLSRKDEIVFSSGLPVPILNDYIVKFTSDGEAKMSVSLFEILCREIRFSSILKIYGFIANPKNIIDIINRKIKQKYIFEANSPPDVIHSNTLELINRNITGDLQKGTFLYCARHLNLIGIIDMTERKLLWSWGKNKIQFPHYPTLLDNNNILVYDNGYDHRGYTRLLELNPIEKVIMWKYEDDPPSFFFSSWGGANQELPNGNILITDSANGRVFEITKDGEIVWEYYNPDIDKKTGKRASIYRMNRIVISDNNFFLDNLN